MAALDLTGYKLTFDDEFNNLSVSQTGAGTTWADIRSEWRFDANSDIGFGNSSFLDAASGYNPFSVQNGVLSITAEPNPTQYGYPGSWASGLITTQGNFSQEYGYFEIRANFSSLPGAWDAFWLLPDKQTPDPNNAGRWQELDVVEHYGSFPQGVYTHVHTTDAAPNVNWQQNLQVYSELAQPGGYHTYGMDWEPNTLTFYVDGQETGSIPTPSDMHSPMYMLADLAIQTSQNPANAPITSYIDYIRAYASPNTIPGVDNLVGQGGTAAAGGATDAGALRTNRSYSCSYGRRRFRYRHGHAAASNNRDGCTNRRRYRNSSNFGSRGRFRWRHGHAAASNRDGWTNRTRYRSSSNCGSGRRCWCRHSHAASDRDGWTNRSRYRHFSSHGRRGPFRS